MFIEKLTQSFKLAFNELTISRFRVQDPTPDTVRKSLYWYPLAGLYIGIAASLLPLFFVACFSSLQAFVLFSGCIYVFMTAWLSGFSGFRNLAIFTDALAERKLSPAERVQKMLAEQTHPGYAGVTACAILAASKLLLIYLLFTRLALFEKAALLGFFLVTTPFFARLFMMVLAGNDRVAPGEPETSIAGKVNIRAAFCIKKRWETCSHLFYWLALSVRNRSRRA
jgi:cobalamin synthase